MINEIIDTIRGALSHALTAALVWAASAFLFELSAKFVTRRKNRSSSQEEFAVRLRNQQGKEVIVSLSGQESPEELEKNLSAAREQ